MSVTISHAAKERFTFLLKKRKNSLAWSYTLDNFTYHFYCLHKHLTIISGDLIKARKKNLSSVTFKTTIKGLIKPLHWEALKHIFSFQRFLKRERAISQFCCWTFWNKTSWKQRLIKYFLPTPSFQHRRWIITQLLLLLLL